MRRVSAAWKARQYASLRELLHPDGTWFLVDDNPRFIVGRDEFVEAIARAQHETVSDFSNDKYEPLSETILLGAAHIRTPLPDGQHGHRLGRYHSCWKSGMACSTGPSVSRPRRQQGQPSRRDGDEASLPPRN
jgi:hypothetical protein